MQTKQALYIDTPIFRRITRLLPHYQKLEKFLDAEVPRLLDSSDLLFTWSQLMEACDLGQIIKEIEKTMIWKQKVEGKNLIGRLGFVDGLDAYFKTAMQSLESLPDLQKVPLLAHIDKAVSHTCKESRPLINNTFLRYRNRIETTDYMPWLTGELAWVFLTSYPFIQSTDQWEKRKICYDSLIALWHKLRTQKGYDLVGYRLFERQYYSYLAHSPDLDFEAAKKAYPQATKRQDLADEIFKIGPLKQNSDLCDGEIIHFAFLGSPTLPVVGIAKGEQQQIGQRMGICGRSLTDLQTCALGWNAQVVLGEILSFDFTKEGDVLHARRNQASPSFIEKHSRSSEQSKDASENQQTSS